MDEISFHNLRLEHLKQIKLWSAHKSIKRWIHIDNWDDYYRYAVNEERTHPFAVYCDDAFYGLLVAEVDNLQVGIFLLIDPALQNRGLGQKTLACFHDAIDTLLNCNLKNVIAYIAVQNHISKQCFQNAGYQYGGMDGDGEEIWKFDLR